MSDCKSHDKLELKIDKLLERSQQQGEALAAVKATLDSAVIRRPEMYGEINRVQKRVNALVGGLMGLLTLAGGAIAFLIR